MKYLKIPLDRPGVFIYTKSREKREKFAKKKKKNEKREKNIWLFVRIKYNNKFY